MYDAQYMQTFDKTSDLNPTPSLKSSAMHRDNSRLSLPKLVHSENLTKRSHSKKGEGKRSRFADKRVTQKVEDQSNPLELDVENSLEGDTGSADH